MKSDINVRGSTTMTTHLDSGLLTNLSSTRLTRVGCYLLDKPSLVMLEITMTSFGAPMVKNKIENETDAHT